MRVVVIGGGISGLVAAHRLKAAGRGLDVQLLEAGPRAGGHAWTTREDGFVIEAGPNGVLERGGEPELRDLARELGIEPKLREARAAARRRFILRRGRLHRAPDSPPTVLTTSLLSPLGKLRLMMEPWAAAPAEGTEETVHQFARRRIGREAAERLVDPAVAGISAGDSRRLSVHAAFPMMVEMEQSHGSLIRAMIARQRAAKAAGQASGPKLVGFEGGMATLIDALVEGLGPALRTGREVRRITARGESLVYRVRGSVDADAWCWRCRPRRARCSLTDAAAAPGVRPPGRGSPWWRWRIAWPRSAARSGLSVDAGGASTLGVVESSVFEGRAPEGLALLRDDGGARHPSVAAEDENG
jgi:oxygen-dependent protoporphyrinogen oxidase